MSDPNLDVPCPTCGAEAGKRCRTLKTGRTTDTHNDRWNQRFYLQDRQSQDEPTEGGRNDHQHGAAGRRG